jgi:hypothetical protein
MGTHCRAADEKRRAERGFEIWSDILGRSKYNVAGQDITSQCDGKH